MDSPRRKGSRTLSDPRIPVIPDIHGHAKGEHRPFAEERPISYSARMLFLWFYHACRRGSPRFLMVTDHINYLTFEDPGAVHTVRRALKLAHAGDLYGAAETAGVDVAHAAVVSEGLRRGMRFSIGAESDNDPRARPDAANIVDAMRPDGILRTVHFITIDHPEKGSDWAWQFDNPEFAHLHDIVGADRTWELYMAKLLDDVEKLPGHVVGHFYAPAEFGHWPDQKKLEGYEDQIVKAAHARGMALEISTRYLYRDNPDDLKQKYIDANARLIKKAKAAGVGIAIGSDAHSPKDQGNAFDRILQLLDSCGVNEIVFPVGGRLARVVLRATREHLEAHAKKRETTTPGSSISGFSRAELGLPEQIEVPAGTRGRARDVGPKKRVSDATRATKRPESSAAAKSTSKRSAESSSSSSKAKAARKSAEPPPKKAAAKPAKPAKPEKPAKAVKPAPVKPAAKGKPAAKAAPKAAAPKAKAAAVPPKKKAAPPAKAAAKKAPPKKAAPKPVAVKKAAAKTAAPKKKLAAKPAPKPAAKKAVKKVVKPPAKPAAKKKPAAKRR